MHVLYTTILLACVLAAHSLRTRRATAGARATGQALIKLPQEIAEAAKWFCWNRAWASANSRFGPADRVDGDLHAADQYLEQMQNYADGLLPADVIGNFRELGKYITWAAANERAEYWSDRDSNLANANYHQLELSRKGPIGSSLAAELRHMCGYAGWHAANTRAGYDDTAENDRRRFNQYADDMSGNAKLVSLSFNTSLAQVSAQAPLLVGDLTLNNPTPELQSMSMTFTKTEGRTRSYSHTVGFAVSISSTVSAGFSLEVVEASASITVGFEASYSHTWANGQSEQNSRSYTYPVNVPAYSTYRGQAVVHEATMNVPYTMTLSIGGHEWQVQGTWEGAAYSSSTLSIIDIGK